MFKEIYIERTGCLGNCPIYRLKILSDGRVLYFGEYFVSIIGNREWQYGEAVIQKISKTIETSKFFETELIKESGYEDVPSCYIAIQMDDGRFQKFKYEYDDTFLPHSPDLLADEIENILDIENAILDLQMYLFLFVEDTNHDSKDFHFLISASSEYAEDLIRETHYPTEKFPMPKWKILKLGETLKAYPEIVDSYLKQYAVSPRTSILHHGEDRKGNELFLLTEKNEGSSHLLFAQNEEDAIQIIQRHFPNSDKEWKIQNMEFYQDSFFYKESNELELDDFPKAIAFSIFGKHYNRPKKFSIEPKFTSPFENAFD